MNMWITYGIIAVILIIAELLYFCVVRALNIPAGQWHTVRVLESGTVIMEVKDGPYIPTSPFDILTLSSSESNQQASFITSSQPSVSPSDSSLRTSAQSVSATDSNNTVSSTFIPAPDTRAFDGGDILRQKKKQ